MDVEKITEYMFFKSRPESADLAMVFGTQYREPLKQVKKIYYDRLTEKILLSGGKNRHTGRNEAREMALNLIDMGVNLADIVIEDKSTNTLENVLFSKQIIEEEIGFQDVRRILVIAKCYHVRRALMTLKRHFPDNIDFLPVTYDLLGFGQNNWHASPVGREKVLSEMDKINKYLVKGDIAEL
ncbi:MAG: YdcF family protein [Patescibacteria group bacterium]|nr:YdcF family protein [Patescibacteria group bacterium]